ncbi:MAG: transcription/translation regulatory transformer protein RfaH [Rhodoferax sp.]
MDWQTDLHSSTQRDSAAMAHGSPGANWAWYLVHTKPRQESVALENLQRQGYHCYLPLYQREAVRRNKVQTVQEPLFSRYLFIHLDSSLQGASWSPIHSTTGVTRLVRFGTSPARVDAALIEALRGREQHATPAPRFEPGQTVRIDAGPLAGLEAIYQCTDAQQRAIVLITIVSQTVRTQLDAAHLRAVH